jgi:hypothetical protein
MQQVNEKDEDNRRQITRTRRQGTRYQYQESGAQLYQAQPKLGGR